jgi:hypothetical protein
MIVRLILLAVLLWVLWYVLNHDVRRKYGERALRRTMRAEAAVDTIKCQQCGAYVATNIASTCSRPDCPFPVINSG